MGLLTVDECQCFGRGREVRAVGGAGKVPSRRKPTGDCAPYEPPAEARHWRAASLGRGRGVVR